jgi:mannose-6-phosphate isomerase-like protein (cupin superfamily)
VTSRVFDLDEMQWTAGDGVVDLRPNQMLVVPPRTPHGCENTGDRPLLVVSVHEGSTPEHTFLEGE